jgi:hypothetical protein
MPTTYVHVTDAPRYVHDNEIVDGERFVLGGALHGRVLFTYACALEVIGLNVTIQNCLFERI